MTPVASISILMYCALDHAKRCIQSVIANTSLPFELILTANGNPEAAEFFKGVAAQMPNVRVIVNSTNEGFVEPNRKALEIASAPLFVMLNDDVVVPPRWLELLAEPFAPGSKVALTGPKGSCCTLNQKFHGFLSARVEYLEGSCLMGRTDLLREKGLFSPEIKFAYGEDSDLSLRMREAGYEIRQVNFRIEHARASTSRFVPGIARIQNENHAYLQRRWGHYLRTRCFDYPIIVRRTGAHGDVLLMTPILRALKERRPENPIYVHTQVPDVLRNNPLIVRASAAIGALPKAQLINLDGTYEGRPDRHFVDTYAEVAGVTIPAQRKLEIYPSAGDTAWAAEKLPGNSWIAIHAGPSTWKGKEWPKERFLEVIRELRKAWQVVLVGSKDFGLECEVDLRGKTTILQMAAAIKRCRLFIGLDSLPMHVSQAVGTKTIGIFGVTDPQFISTDGSWFRGIMGEGPTAGARHRVNGKTHVNDNGVAIKTVTVERVLAAAKEGLE